MSLPPYWQSPDGRHTLYCGDCLDVLPGLPHNAAIITDPPYGIGHSSSYGASWQNTQIQGDESTAIRDKVLQWADGWEIPWVAFGSWKSPHPNNTRATLVWDKGPAFGMGDLRFPWKQSWECIYVGGVGWKGDRDEGVLRGPVVVSWESKGRVHPHQKPEWLLQHFMEKLPHIDIILDPFVGSGTTMVAAARTGRRSIGIEMERKYCDIAVARMERELERPYLPGMDPADCVTQPKLYQD